MSYNSYKNDKLSRKIITMGNLKENPSLNLHIIINVHFTTRYDSAVLQLWLFFHVSSHWKKLYL